MTAIVAMTMTLQRISKWYHPLRRRVQRFWQNEEGANLVLMAFVLPVLLGIAGLAVDGSNIYYQNQRMQVAADAAALAGARLLATGDQSYTRMSAEINDLATRNGADVGKVTWRRVYNQRGELVGVRVIVSRSVDAYFARIYGHEAFSVSAEAQAQFETVTGAGGLMPFAVSCRCKPGDVGEDSGSGDGGGDSGGDDSGSGGGGEGDNSSNPESNPNDSSLPSNVTVELEGEQISSYAITYVGQSGKTWTYEVNELAGEDLTQWVLGIESCLDQVVSFSPSASLGVDSGSGEAGIGWNVDSSFSTGTFSFTLDKFYPSGTVSALAKTGTSFGAVGIRGPICDGTNTGEGSGGSGDIGLCLSTLDFETAAGAPLATGQIIDTEWANWGVRVAATNAGNYPAMIFSTANPTGGDDDLGTPNMAFGGPGVGSGGGAGMPGANSVPLGKVLIVAESNNSANPDDNANGGTLIFTFDYAVRVDDVQILDIDDASAAGTVRAYRDMGGSTLVATGRMLGLGDNSVQTIALNALAVQRLEVYLPKGGALASIVFCRSGSQSTYTIGNFIWSDTNANGIQEVGEPGIAGVVLELYINGQSYVVARATTNAGGEYRFNNLPPGTYDVRIASSNFSAGKPLYDMVFSPANVGDDALDSDFANTGRATVNLTNANNLTIDGGLRPLGPAPDPGSQSAVVQVKGKKDSQYSISFVGVSGKTWTYRVAEISGDHFIGWGLGIANCLGKIVSYSPSSGYRTGVVDLVNGIHWEVSNGIKQGTFSFTLDGNYYPVPRQSIVRSSSASAQVSISGPDCSQPVPDMPQTGSDENPESGENSGGGSGGGNTGTGSDCVCDGDIGFVPGATYTLRDREQIVAGNFGWLHWKNQNSDTPTLIDNIKDPSRSDIVRIGDKINGATGNMFTQEIETVLLNKWLGKEVIIPIYKEVSGTGSNVLYTVCGFAVFKLTSANGGSAKSITGTFVRSVINSEFTNDTVRDIGARDVRMVK